DRALHVCAEALQHAERSQHSFSKAMARTITLRVHQFRGEASVVANQAGAAIAISQEHEFDHYLAMALILRGWASAQQGEFEKGIAEIQDGLEKERATGGLLFETYSLALLADACIKNERYGQAFDFLEQAHLKLDEQGSIRFYAAEIYRLLGEVNLRSRRDLDQAERWFAKGLTLAREQKAKSLAVRLAVSRDDLFAERQIGAEYRPRLAEIYASFSEGFDTADLLAAKARLKKP